MLWISLQSMQRIFYFTNIQVLYIFLDNIWKICTYHTPYGNVTSAGWQVTLCDLMWHVSSCSGVATLRTAIHLLLTYLPLTVTKLTTLETVLFGPPCRGKSGPALGGTEYRLMPSACRLIVWAKLWNLQFRYLVSRAPMRRRSIVVA